MAGRGIKQFPRGPGRLHPIPNRSHARPWSTQAQLAKTHLASALSLQQSGEPLGLGKLLRLKSQVNLPPGCLQGGSMAEGIRGATGSSRPFSIQGHYPEESKEFEHTELYFKLTRHSPRVYACGFGFEGKLPHFPAQGSWMSYLSGPHSPPP